jgi:hypothetical protein
MGTKYAVLASETETASNVHNIVMTSQWKALSFCDGTIIIRSYLSLNYGKDNF